MAKKNGSKQIESDAADPARGRTALLYQLLETEMGGVQVYRTALLCAVNAELKKEWTKYLAETERHVQIARALLQKLGFDPDAELAARVIVRHSGDALVQLMLEALATSTPDEAQLVAAECVVKAETKDHMNWSLIGLLADKTSGDESEAMRAAYDEVEPEEDHHLYHTTGWARELWAQALGLPAVLPPPEEKRNVESQMEAARAKQEREASA
ncbi:MAG TPA: hypothetical protein VM261_33065 [Kofleriaceae bacterium]|nr:hypothetical protein [Kofleriaceae bacterium]